MRQYYVYIVASRKNGTIYTGVTNDLQRRSLEHRNGHHEGFSKRYGVGRLVYYEYFPYITDAIAREKCIKGWCRQWKIDLIEGINPDWRDLYLELNG